MSLNKSLIEKRFAAHLSSYNKYASVQSGICGYLGLLVDKYVDIEVSRVLEVGAGTGFLTSVLSRKFNSAHWVINDITPHAEEFIREVNAATNVTYVFGDAEKLKFENKFDLVVSSSAVQWFDDLESFIASLEMTKDGYIVLSSFGTRNFEQINKILGIGLKYKSLEELTEIVSNSGFKIIHSEQQIKTLEFDSPLSVLKHIKMTGVNSVENFVWTRTKLNNFCDRYEKEFNNFLTYNPTIIIAKKTGQ